MRALKPQTYQFFSQHFAAFRRAERNQPLMKLFLTELRRHVGSAVAQGRPSA
jgi:hypothetical protein